MFSLSSHWWSFFHTNVACTNVQPVFTLAVPGATHTVIKCWLNTTELQGSFSQHIKRCMRSHSSSNTGHTATLQQPSSQKHRVALGMATTLHCGDNGLGHGHNTPLWRQWPWAWPQHSIVETMALGMATTLHCGDNGPGHGHNSPLWRHWPWAWPQLSIVKTMTLGIAITLHCGDIGPRDSHNSPSWRQSPWARPKLSP